MDMNFENVTEKNFDAMWAKLTTAEKLAFKNKFQQKAIEAAAKEHGIDLLHGGATANDEAYTLAYHKNKKLFELP